MTLPASSKTTRRWLAVYREALRKVGVTLEITPLEWATFLARVREGAYDMAALGMQLAGPHTDLYLQLHSSQAKDGQNYGRFKNARVDKLLVEMRQALSPERRKALALELQKLLAREMPVIPLFSLSETGLVAKYVKGVYASDVWYQLRDWSL